MTSDIDNWDEFVETRRFEKATSIQGQLDTLAAQMNEIQTDTKRVANIIDQLNGDNAGIEYENNNFDPMEQMGAAPEAGMPMDEGMGGEPAPEEMPEEMPEGEDGAAGGIEDVTQPAEGPADAEADDAALPEQMPPMGGEGDITDEELDAILGEAPPGAEEMGAPMDGVPAEADMEAQGEPGLEGAMPVGDDMVSKIKNMIAMTSDPETLSGLADLLTTALSQTPARPMEAEGLVEGSEEAPFAESAEDFVKNDNGVADLGDVEKVEEAVEAPEDDGPKAETAETETTDFKYSADEDEKKDEPEPEEKAEEASEEAPEASDEAPAEAEIAIVAEPVEEEPCPEAQEIAVKVADAVEDIVEDVLNGETEEDIEPELETFAEAEVEEPKGLPSFQEMFMKNRESVIGIDGKTDAWFNKATEPAPEGLRGSTIAEGTPADEEDYQVDGMFSNAGAALGKQQPFKESDEPVGDEPIESHEPCDGEQTSFADSEEAPAISEEPIAKSCMDTGKHIKSFQEMMTDSQNMGFAKSIDRPDHIATAGGDIRRPELSPIRKSADRPALKVGPGVDMFESMQADWDQYFQWRDGQKL